ncbi:biopolymer transport protein ExbD [Rhodoferax lithotrophicus]|uniref:Biopolymer transport protein ExbD n=1 Tax=Rhodoferax lithotrophicus TaxID=2798804 RepID=A0ABN6D4K4_9BURK|nr:ExbD/TolR family protein [Rhodoferax sp. MIZ03]BCO26909.1 biopolymer transport protein ExbD [Rhodoferax sp. MIZ03]
MAAIAHRGRGRRTINEINMVPFIDVMLVLLIIFMVTAPLIAPSVIDLPSVGKAAKQPDQVVQVIIGQDEALQLKIKDQSSSVNIKALAKVVQQAQAEAPNTAVVISADKSVKYEAVVKVMDTLQRAGIARVGLSVQLTP